MVRVPLRTRPSREVRLRLRLLFDGRSGQTDVAWGSLGCGRVGGGLRSGLLERYPIGCGPSSGEERCFVPGGYASN